MTEYDELKAEVEEIVTNARAAYENPADGFVLRRGGRMNAQLRPLAGKYYGSFVEFENGDVIKIWVMGDWKPSKRQLELWDMTEQEAKDDGMMSDSHFESQFGYDLAMKIIEAVK